LSWRQGIHWNQFLLLCTLIGCAHTTKKHVVIALLLLQRYDAMLLNTKLAMLMLLLN